MAGLGTARSQPAVRRDVRHWRNPEPGVDLGDGLSLFHDARSGEFAARTGAASVLRLTIYQFDGSYVSLVRAIGAGERRRLGPGRRLVATLVVSASRPLTVFVRANLETPTATERLHEVLVVHDGPRAVVFDLDAVRLALPDLDAAWIDVIFSEPEMAEIVLTSLDLAVTEYGR